MEGHMGPGAWRYCPECRPQPSPGEWLGWYRHRAPWGVVLGPLLFEMPLCLRSTTRPGRWCFGAEGVSCHNTCATGGPGCLGQDRTGPGSEALCSARQSLGDMPPQ